jgi:hypothetical protein
MKKISLIALFAALVAVNVHATDLVPEKTHVTWSTPLHIEAAQFANAQPGQKIVITYTDAKEMVESENKGSIIEFKVMNEHFDHLAGSREALRLWGNGSLDQFLTASAVDSIKAHGLEITGNDFTVTKVALEDGKELKEGFSVWTGYFWVNSWNTLELYWNGYAGVDWSKAKAIRFYVEANDDTLEALNFLESWENGGKIADKSGMTAGKGYYELTLTNELRTRVAEAGHWMIQYAPKGAAEFNATDIVLVMEDGGATAVENTTVSEKAVKTIVDGQIVIIKNGVRYNTLGAQLR